jgi:hypothetical protein
VLQTLINRGSKGPTRNQVLFDNEMLNAMKDLREGELLLKEDIVSIVSCIGHAVVDANYVLISSLIGPLKD